MALTNPDNEAAGLKKFEKLPFLQEFLHDYDTEKPGCMPTCANLCRSRQNACKIIHLQKFYRRIRVIWCGGFCVYN